MLNDNEENKKALGLQIENLSLQLQNLEAERKLETEVSLDHELASQSEFK